MLSRFVDPAAQKVTMLSIPRDLQVPIAGGGYGKIMEAFSNGGARTAIQTVERDFDVRSNVRVLRSLFEENAP